MDVCFKVILEIALTTMIKTMSNSRSLGELLSDSQIIKAPGVYDGLSALLVQQAGFDCAFLSGAGIAFSRYGRPDMGLITAAEVADTVAVIRERIDIPLIVDMDTGFGNALNVQRTVKTFERAGASAVQMEDQVMPKRCGHMKGKNVISSTEMVGKIKAAVDARACDSTLVIARTDALGVNGFEDALQRAEHYINAGADVLFIEAPATTDQMQTIAERFSHRIPLMHNLVEGSNSPISTSTQLGQIGYKIALYPVALLHQFVPAAQQLLAHIKDHGSTCEFPNAMFNLNDMNDLLGADQLLDDGRRYDSEQT